MGVCVLFISSLWFCFSEFVVLFSVSQILIMTSSSILTARDDDGFSFYQYDPSVAAAAIFAVLFLITTAYHCWQAWTKRTLYFIPLLIGGHFEWTGYVFRIISSYNLTSTSIFIIQTLLLLLPPSLFAASIYMVLGRIILFTNGESMAPIRANWLTKIFVIR